MKRHSEDLGHSGNWWWELNIPRAYERKERVDEQVRGKVYYSPWSTGFIMWFWKRLKCWFSLLRRQQRRRKQKFGGISNTNPAGGVRCLSIVLVWSTSIHSPSGRSIFLCETVLFQVKSAYPFGLPTHHPPQENHNIPISWPQWLSQRWSHDPIQATETQLLVVVVIMKGIFLFWRCWEIEKLKMFIALWLPRGKGLLKWS